nr:MAG TPA: hypothetical protein [Caudoviricetes sp.]
METKVEVRTIPLHGLFIHRKQVWRSLGKLRAESHSTSAQKVYMNEYGTEVYTENADFIDGLKVTPYTVTFTILTRVLGILAERAIEINDPALNIIMMNLGLYEGVHDKNAGEVISRLRKLIADNKKEEG